MGTGYPNGWLTKWSFKKWWFRSILDHYFRKPYEEAKELLQPGIFRRAAFKLADPTDHRACLLMHGLCKLGNLVLHFLNRSTWQSPLFPRLTLLHPTRVHQSHLLWLRSREVLQKTKQILWKLQPGNNNTIRQQNNPFVTAPFVNFLPVKNNNFQKVLLTDFLSFLPALQLGTSNLDSVSRFNEELWDVAVILPVPAGVRLSKLQDVSILLSHFHETKC